MEEFAQGISYALGLNVEDLNVWQMALRALVVYVVALSIVRVGEKRLLGRSTAFDFILAIILGSVVSRAINGGAPFFPTLVAGALLVGVHWLFAWLAFRSDRFGTLIKGSPRILVKDGEILWDATGKSHISRQDLLGALRTEAGIDDPAKVKVARLERSGDISAIPGETQPKILEVAVADGVQTIRIRVG